jgi:spore coat protein CotH
MRCSSRPVLAAVVVAAWALLAPSPAAAQSANDFFNGDVVQRVDLNLHSADWEKLKQNFQSNEYYPADVVWNGITVHNTGIRSRGNGSRSSSKPGLRVDIDRYATAQTFLGLKSFILDNLVQDPSAVHETVAMKFFARMNIPAPREAHARLYINGVYAGLYAVVESIDKSFLARVFGEINGDTQNDGFLYEYNFTDHWTFNYFGSDLQPYKTRFDPKTHETATEENKWRPIETIVRLANDLTSSQYLEQLDPKLDLRALVRYVAVQNFVGENDGFLGYDGMNNFYLYRKENSEQHIFVSWDEDNAFWGPEYPLDLRHDENVLFRKAMEIEELRNLYYATLAEAAHTAETPEQGSDLGWLESLVRRQLDMVHDALAEDGNKPYSMDNHANQRNAMIIFSSQRSRFVQANMPQ